MSRPGRWGSALAALVVAMTAGGIGIADARPADHPAAGEWQPQRRDASGQWVRPAQPKRPAGSRIPDSYVVVLGPGAARDAATTATALVARHGGSIERTYDGIGGFAVRGDEATAARLAADPNVALVEPNSTVTASDNQDNPPSWGLDRIDQRVTAPTRRYAYSTRAATVTAYVIDSGIWTANQDFGGRATIGYDAVGGEPNGDCLGHGTHVAGTVGGTRHGVAKGVKLVGVRVFGCGDESDIATIIAGVDWVTKNAKKPAVVNMSLGGSASKAFDDAVTRSVDTGLTYVAAAGNEDDDACQISPARVPAVITVGATTRGDARDIDSNKGKCVDLFAPGADIRSAYLGPNSTRLMSGTSMAAPHVTGAAALYLAAHPDATPAQVSDALIAASTKDVVKNPGGAPNRLLFTELGPTSPPVPVPPGPGAGPAPFSGAPFRSLPVPPGVSSDDASLNDVAVVDAKNAWAVGGGPSVKRWDGLAWTDQPVRMVGSLYAVAAKSATDVWAVGAAGGSGADPVGAHFDGTKWTRHDMPLHHELGYARDVAVVGDEFWAVTYSGGTEGAYSELLRWTGTEWKPMPLPRATEFSVTTISAKSAADVWVSGLVGTRYGDTRAVVLHYDGVKWTETSIPVATEVGVSVSVSAIVPLGPGNAMLSGTHVTSDGETHGLLARWDGTRWGRVTTFTGGGESSLWTMSQVDGVLYAGGWIGDWAGAPAPLVVRQDPATGRWQRMSVPRADEATGGQVVTALAPDGKGAHAVGMTWKRDDPYFAGPFSVRYPG